MNTHVVILMVAIILITKGVFCEAGVATSLALFRSCDRSSKYSPDTGPGKAVDGRTDDTIIEMHFSSTSVGVDPDPYFFVMLEYMYLVQTVEIISRKDCCPDKMSTLEVRVGASKNDDGGTTNPLCGEPKNMDNLPEHTFRCELYGQYVTVKKTNVPTQYSLVVLEVMVNKEPTENIAFGKPTSHSSLNSGSSDSSMAVDGILGAYNFVTGNVPPHWMTIDLESSKAVNKIVIVPRKRQEYLAHLKKIMITLGDDSTNNGKDNRRIGDVYDFSEYRPFAIYLLPRLSGRYFYFQSLLDVSIHLSEIEIYSESMPNILLRSNGLKSHNRVFYEGRLAVLKCPSKAYPIAHIAWLRNGVMIQNRTTNTHLIWTVNDTKGSEVKYECYATNKHGKDCYPINVTIAGRYEMCFKQEEIRDSSRNLLSPEVSSDASKSDADTFDLKKMYTFFNPHTSKYMKLTTKCPPASSCGTVAPGWLDGSHPIPEQGFSRRKVCFHYNGNCCYKAIYISVTNCPGMFAYQLTNTKDFSFPARYCFEDDKELEAFALFKSVPLLFGPVGGSSTALVNHVIAKENGIDDTAQCLIVCMMNKCRSLNYHKLQKVCEVNNATRDDYPRDLSAKPGFQYYHPMKKPVVLNNGYN